MVSSSKKLQAEISIEDVFFTEHHLKDVHRLYKVYRFALQLSACSLCRAEAGIKTTTIDSPSG